jgi:hypothetical protein
MTAQESSLHTPFPLPNLLVHVLWGSSNNSRAFNSFCLPFLLLRLFELTFQFVFLPALDPFVPAESCAHMM